ncbi:sensor histidine kinase [Ferdinandcohnia quinoae]|uniref:histidine kinase n=1 Tax=Fredinandcohnia quinoae TaxID=2918902 RepID=A0AAW5DZX3_9BACI|nr:sensor histidine kinase [Fredinandcohnia sp. SECRCQ15]MCH1625603.1 sensor histidine kinase [Fredinandcohnia sp. SECRCQ15]
MYLIYYGIVATTLFIATSNRIAISGFIIAFIVVWIAIVSVGYAENGDIHYWSNIVSFAFVIFCSIVGSLLRKLMLSKETIDNQYNQLTASHDALKEAHDQLHDYAKKVEELTVIRERNRIAREIHDTVGHKMTALLIQMQLAQEMMLIDTGKSSSALEKCDQLARDALQEVRLSVRTIHDEDCDKMTFEHTLKKMLKEFSTMTKLETSLHIKGDFAKIPTSIQPTITRIVQESLTNAKRHGSATSCHVLMVSTPESIVVEVRDNGEGTENIIPGFGLVNMRERVLEHGGTLQYKSEKDAGFSIIAEFPNKQLKWTSGGVT